MLTIPGVARDQVWYKRPPFYNSNFSKPNGSASPFGEAQLDCSAAMTPGFYPRRAQPGTAIQMLLGTLLNKGPHTSDA